MLFIPIILEKGEEMITVIEDRQPTLEEAQKIVGGNVEMVHSPTEPEWQILVNEE